MEKQTAVSSMKHRVHVTTSSVRTKVSGVLPMLREQLYRLEMNMRSNPGKWAGIASGAGFGLGMAGRILRNRASMTVPHIVVIEASL